MEDSIPLKHCPACDNDFPSTAEYFHRRGSKLHGKCKKCRSEEETRRVLERHQRREAGLHAIPLKKTCTGCKKEKDLNEDNFCRNYRTSDGWHQACLECTAVQGRETYQRHHESRLERVRIYNLNHHEEKIARGREYYHKNIAEYKRKSAIYRETHRELLASRSRIYAKSHLPQRRAHERNRRARIRQYGGTHTAAQIREQYRRQKGKCYYCRNKVKWGEHHVDHTFPVSRVAGMGIPANSIEYLVITCKRCNLTKRNRFPWEWPEGGRLL